MPHESASTDRKKAEDEYRRKEDWRHKREVMDRRQDTASTQGGSSAADTEVQMLSSDASWLIYQDTKQGSVSQVSSVGTRESAPQEIFLTSVPTQEEAGRMGAGPQANGVMTTAVIGAAAATAATTAAATAAPAMTAVAAASVPATAAVPYRRRWVFSS